MTTKRKTIITNSKEIYQKFNQLHFTSEIILNEVKNIQIKKILNNINKTNEVLHMEKIGERMIITKKAPLNFNIYLK